MVDLRYEERFYFGGIVDRGGNYDDFGNNYGNSVSNSQEKSG